MRIERRMSPKGIIKMARRAMEADYKIWGQCANAGTALMEDQCTDVPVPAEEKHYIVESCSPNSTKARCWCAQGLLVRCDGRTHPGTQQPRQDVVDLVEKAREELYPGMGLESYIDVNDGEVHKTWKGAYDAIIRIFKRAEELAA